MAGYTSALRVLIVDDEPLIRWALHETLTTAGHVPLQAGTAREAIDAVSQEPPVDVILLDYQLPDCHGFGLLSTLRGLAPTAAILMMSAYAHKPDLAWSRREARRQPGPVEAIRYGRSPATRRPVESLPPRVTSWVNGRVRGCAR